MDPVGLCVSPALRSVGEEQINIQSSLFSIKGGC